MSLEIIEKIKKLLRLGRSANRHEAELALQRAFDLASRHKVDVTTLDLDAETKKIAHEWFHVGQRISFLRQRTLGLVTAYFHVDCCTSRPRVVFVGTPSDIAIAHYVLEFIDQQGRKWLREFEAAEKSARRKITENKRKNFIQGFIYGLAEQLKERHKTLILEDSKTAIVLAEQGRQRDAYMNELIPNMTTRKLDVSRKNVSALMSGFIRGQATKINKPLEAARQPVLALQ